VSIKQEDTKSLKEKYQQYLRSSDWEEKSSEARKLANFKCCVCGKKAKLQVHHIWYGSWYDVSPEEDLLVLCGGCHQLAHTYDVINVSKNKAIGILKEKLKEKIRKANRKVRKRNNKTTKKENLKKWIEDNQYEANGFMVIAVDDLMEHFCISDK
jgi:hypothetical protein